MKPSESELRPTKELLSTVATDRSVPDDLPDAEVLTDRTESVQYVIERKLDGVDTTTVKIFPKGDYDRATETTVPLDKRFDSPPESFTSRSMTAVDMTCSPEDCSPCNATGSVTCMDCGGDAVLDCPNYCRDGLVDCGTCDGTQRTKCPECTGFFRGGFGTDDGIKECPRCDGSGECPDCDGQGELQCTDCGGSGQHSCPECNGGTVACSRCGSSSGGFFGGSNSGVIQCDRCDGEGGRVDTSECRLCGGRGCGTCDGKGYHEDFTTCRRCGGDGERDCPDCSGQGSTTCRNCRGRGHNDCRSCSGGTNPCSSCDRSGRCPNPDCRDGGINCPNCGGSASIRCPDCTDGTEQCTECRGRGVIDCGCGTGKITCSQCDGDRQVVRATKAEVEYTPLQETRLESALGVTEEMLNIDNAPSVETEVLTDGGMATPDSEWTERKIREIRSFPVRKVTYEYGDEEYTVFDVDGEIYARSTPDSKLVDDLSDRITAQRTSLQEALVRRDEYLDDRLETHRNDIQESLDRRERIAEMPLKPIAIVIFLLGIVLIVL